jgi:hypothetical protein
MSKTTAPSASLWWQHILPFSVLVVLLGVGTVLGDYLLHRLNLVWVGRYLGIPGTLLILASLLYSMRKRKLLVSGTPKSWLNFHELSAWLGSLLVLIHAGVHFNAILPWLATIGMGVNVISGMVGKLLLGRSRQHVIGQREHYQLRGLSKPEVEQAVFWESVTFDAMTRWRKVHIPILSLLRCWPWVTSSACSCSGDGHEPADQTRVAGQSADIGCANLCISSSDGRPGEIDSGTREAGGRLLCLSRFLYRG